jgi:NAD(P)-dependent dehydrogenase (short-subunit alcohol dehydrogenase family)
LRYTRQFVVEGGYAPSVLKFGMSEVTCQAGNNMHSPLIVVVTGANTGIGKATVHQLCTILSNRDPNHVSHSKSIILLLCRSLQKGQEAIDDIRNHESKRSQSLIQQCQMQVIQCDLCSFASIRNAVQDIVDVASAACEIADIMETESRKSVSPPVIHSLINNAGVMLSDLSYTIDHHETCIQANFLGHFLLTSLLLPYISTSILNVTSATYRLTNTSSSVFNIKHFGDYVQCKNGLRRYSLFGQYALTKWFNILHTSYLATMYPHIFAAAIHPGIVRTDVVRNMPWYLRPDAVSALILSTLQKTPTQGAWNTVHVWALACIWRQEKNSVSSSSAEETLRQYNGQYWVNRRRQALVQSPSCSDHIPLEQQAQILWKWAIEQVTLTNDEVEQMTRLQTNTVDNSTTTANDRSKRE